MCVLLLSPVAILVFHRFQEKRVYELKKTNQELEKFKFVLDYKIKELKKQLEPKEEEMKQAQDQISEVIFAARRSGSV